MSLSDIFVILDNVQFEKGEYQNKVKIKTPQGEQWLTVPVSYRFPQKINEVKLSSWDKNKEKIIKTIKANYSKSKNFADICPELETVLMRDYANLADLNLNLINFIKDSLEIKTRIEIASNYSFKGNSDDRLVNICKHFKTDAYISGSGGKKYIDKSKFEKEGIKMEYDEFSSPEYPQLWGGFIPNLSSIDYLFNREKI